jgi:predicted SAM-dependent methyltransferase
MTKLLVNLGAGNKLVQPPGPGWVAIQHDRFQHRPEINAVWDLNVLPWPWPQGSVSALIAHSVFEHLELPLIEAMNESWRILKPFGRLDVKLPLWNRARSYDDPTHQYVVGPHIFDNFDPTTERGTAYGVLYGILPWRIVEVSSEAGPACLRGILEALK